MYVPLVEHGGLVSDEVDVGTCGTSHILTVHEHGLRREATHVGRLLLQHIHTTLLYRSHSRVYFYTQTDIDTHTQTQQKHAITTDLWLDVNSGG